MASHNRTKIRGKRCPKHHPRRVSFLPAMVPSRCELVTERRVAVSHRRILVPWQHTSSRAKTRTTYFVGVRSFSRATKNSDFLAVVFKPGGRLFSPHPSAPQQNPPARQESAMHQESAGHASTQSDFRIVWSRKERRESTTKQAVCSQETQM